MKMGKKHIVVIFLSGCLLGTVQGQYSGATVKLEKNSILIGDQVNMELLMTAPAGSRVQWPLILDTVALNVEIIRKSGIDTVSSGKEQFTLKQDLIITSFDSGSYVIHPILFKYSHQGDTAVYFTETMPVVLDVQTVGVDQAGDIKPIKPPFTAPVTFREILPWIGLLLLIAALAAAIYYFMKRRKQVKPAVSTRLNAAIPPYEAAIEALENLRHRKLWQSGRIKEYYSEMTEIVREYIELRFPVRAMEMTTGEIYSALKQTEVNSGAREKLNQVLILADLVKFAKEQPLPLENDLSLNQCMEFVKETKPLRQSEAVVGEKSEVVEQNITR
jgi:hypothetical protein